MKLSGHPTIRYLWTCHHSALLITCTLVNLSSVICCHYLMTMALACIQATQRHFVRLNQGGGTYSIGKQSTVWHLNMKHKRKGKTSNAPNVSRQQREKKSGKCKLLLPGQHCILGTLIWQENGEIKKKRRSGKQNYFQSSDIIVKAH